MSAKKRGKDIKKKKYTVTPLNCGIYNSFSQLLAPGLWQIFAQDIKTLMTNYPTNYPGRIIDFDDLADLSCLTENQMNGINYYAWIDKLPPGYPLDEDIFESILFHLTWWRDINKYFVSGKGTDSDVGHVQNVVTSKIELMYIEAVWRKL